MNLVTAMTVTAVVDEVLALPHEGPVAVGWTAFLLLCAAGPVLLALWGTGLGVRRRRLRVVAREENALTHSVRQAALAVAAERRRIAAELHETVLERTTRMVVLAENGGGLDEVAAETRAALAAMRELLRSLRGGAGDIEGEAQRAPQPVAADLTHLCRTLGATGRRVTLHGLPAATEDLPAPVSLTVYRVVEAALGAGDRGPGRVTLRRRRGRVHITVTGVPLAAAGPVAERLRVQVRAGEGELAVDRAGTLRVSLPAGPSLAPAEEAASSP
ncbi:histidine kinase OS=Streptomyces fumanus OX=67302 GN=GCM10018772_55520 PE=4 SV=1 [Streptomyces fumanus]